MRKCIVFVLVFSCALGLWGCTKQESLTIYPSIRCPDCGSVRKADEETCIQCEIKRELIEQIIAEKQTEVVLPPQSR